MARRRKINSPLVNQAAIYDAEGQIGAPISYREIVVPEVVESDEKDGICWTMDREQVKTVRATSKLLEDFAKLESAPDMAILKFAKRWGVLGFKDGELQTPLREGFEPYAFWRKMAKKFCAALRIRTALDLDPPSPGSIQDWSCLDRFIRLPRDDGGKRFIHPPFRLEYVPLLLELQINSLLRLSRVGLRLDTRSKAEDGWKVTIASYTYPNLFGALCVQLMLVVAGAEGLYCCTGCRSPYIRPKGQRRPKPHQNNYCSRCGRQRAVHDADRRRKQKKREAKRMKGEGLTIREIAKRLKSKPEVIKRWTHDGSPAE